MKVAYTEPIFCPVDHYTCMMPVEYKIDKADNKYHKVKMACHCVEEGKCKEFTVCDHFITSPEIIESWKLREK